MDPALREGERPMEEVGLNAQILKMVRDGHARQAKTMDQALYLAQIVNLLTAVVQLAASDGVDAAILKQEAKEALDAVRVYVEETSGKKP